jgi:hypothetical protein
MSTNERDFLGIYIDLENVQKNIDIAKLMKDIVVKYETDSSNQEPVYAVKIACGNANSITKFREQLKELNFEIRETPHVTGKKNRSDLIISLDAFEKLFLDRPSINQFVFVTNDSDFTVIMDILRRYGRMVVLVTNEEDSKRSIFNNCSDDIMLIDDYSLGGDSRRRPRPARADERAKEVFKNHEPDDIAIKMCISILRLLDPDREYMVSQIGSKFKEMDKSFDIRKTSFKKFTKLLEYCSEKKLVSVHKDERGNMKFAQINLEDLDV